MNPLPIRPRAHVLFTRLLGAAALVLVTTTCARPKERWNLLLITVDTLRADRVAAGASRPITPRIDELAADGLLFERVQSPRAKTTPAIASLMTGLYPHDHGVRDLTTPLPPRVPVLAESLRRRGWKTGALIGNYVLKSRLSGMSRGFDLWVEDLPQTQGVPPTDVPQRTATSLTHGALVALGEEARPDPAGGGPAQPLVTGNEPWFLWLHYMDPHGLYDPPPEHRLFTRPGPEWIPPRIGRHEQHVAEYNVPDEARSADGRIDAAAVRALYDGEAHYVDAEIGRLLDRLRASGKLDRTVVVVTADHGESLGEHDYWFEHGRYAYEATCRVPFVLWLPPSFPDRPAPGVRGGDLSLVEVAPTLLELIEGPRLPAPSKTPQLRGESRAELVVRDADGPRAVFCEKVERTDRSGAVHTKAVRLGDWKFLRRYAWFEEPGADQSLRVLSEELYDLAADPYEEHDLVKEPPEGAPLTRLRAELLRFSAAEVRFEDLARTLQEMREELRRNDPETLRIFEALGY